jgi:hypothetical protein
MSCMRALSHQGLNAVVERLGIEAGQADSLIGGQQVQVLVHPDGVPAAPVLPLLLHAELQAGEVALAQPVSFILFITLADIVRLLRMFKKSSRCSR